ncbi:MAG: hypothetical protein ABTQ29_00190 [Siculibacillus sp.]
MSDVERRPITSFAAPYRREVRLEEARFESGMKMLRVIVREGHRITQLDLDAATARGWGEAMVAWAAAREAAGDEGPSEVAEGA